MAITVGQTKNNTLGVNVTEYDYPASQGELFIGDLVVKSGNANDINVYATGNTPLGNVVSIKYFDGKKTVEDVKYPGNVTGAKNVKVLVMDSEDNLITGPVKNGTIADAEVGQNIEARIESGSDATGRSGHGFDAGTNATTASLPFRIEKVFEVGDKQHAVCSYNKHYRKTTTGI